jgi:hypothetical protein
LTENPDNTSSASSSLSSSSSSSSSTTVIAPGTSRRTGSTRLNSRRITATVTNMNLESSFTSESYQNESSTQK